MDVSTRTWVTIAIVLLLSIVFVDAVVPSLIQNRILYPSTARLLVLIFGILVVFWIFDMLLDRALALLITVIVVVLALHYFGIIDLRPRRIFPI
jgi:peptidoglycan/LPS O-acetylase OafA/YrhL